MMDARVAERWSGQRLIWIVSASSADQLYYVPSNDVTAGDLVVVFGPAGDLIEVIATIKGGKRGGLGVEVTLGDPRVELGEPTNADAETLAMLARLARHLGAQPRRLKRLINTYRFVKSGLSDPELAVFMELPAEAGGGAGAYQSVLALLALVTGAPTLAPAILHEFATRPAGTTVVKCKEQLRDLAGSELECVERVLDTYRSTKGDGVMIDELRRWAPRIAQFTLTGPVAVSTVATSSSS